MSGDELVKAITNDDVAELERCLGKVSSSSRKTDSRKALHHAASMGSIGATQWLLEAKAEVNWADVLGLTALHKAAHSRKAKPTELLLEARAQVNRGDKRHTTALHFAASGGNVAVMQLLLEARADVNLANRLGETPLHKAAHAGHLELAQLLLEAKADPDQTNVKSQMAVDIAEEACHYKVMEVLESVNESDKYDFLLDGFFWHCIASMHGAIHVAWETHSTSKRRVRTALQQLDTLHSEVGTAASSTDGIYGSNGGLVGEQTLDTLPSRVDTAASSYSKQLFCGLEYVSGFILDVSLRLVAPLREIDLPIGAIP